MKELKTYIVLLALCLFTASCADKSYEGIESEMTGEEEMLVHIIIGDSGDIMMSKTPDTHSKGSGPIEDEDVAIWNGKTINIFAFKRDFGTDYSLTSASKNQDCLIDGSRDKNDCLGGKEATINTNDFHIQWSGKEDAVYYNRGEDPYDFFAYYTDNPIADTQIYRSREAVSIDVDIDGSTDFMSAYAELTDDQLNKPGYSDKDIQDIKSYSFSSWSARRNIHPVFYFRHHLTRFDFVMKAGWEAAENIFIDSLVIKSRKKATFTVAHKNPARLGLDFSGAKHERIQLSEADGSPLRKDYWQPKLNLTDDEMEHLGGSLLVAPDVQYDAYLYLKEQKDGKTITHENKINIVSSEGRFEAGSQYLVKATIYGLTSVDITVTLEKWQDGGSTSIGTDKLEDKI